MTVINAIRFDDYSGAMVCDEERTFEGTRRMLTYDKARPLVPEQIQLDQGIAAVYGHTGTLAVSDDIQRSVFNQLEFRYSQVLAAEGKIPAQFLTIEEIARLTFAQMSALKHRHVDEIIGARYGFTANDFVQGFYRTSSNEKCEIQQKEVVDQVTELMTWKNQSAQLNRLYINSGIVAGYDPNTGFGLYLVSMSAMTCEPVQFFFQTLGSGRDMASISFSDFAFGKKPAKPEPINSVEGMITIMQATNLAARYAIGVGGYYNIFIIDGRKPPTERLLEIQDHRSKLASEIVCALDNNLLSYANACTLIDHLLFQNYSFKSVLTEFYEYAPDVHALSRLLRKWKVQA